VQNFYEKEWNLPPCRRRIGPVVQADACQVSDRVTRVSYASYAVQAYFGLLTGSNARFACGSMVLFDLFSQKLCKRLSEKVVRVGHTAYCLL
jgi:hypothetical protein